MPIEAAVVRFAGVDFSCVDLERAVAEIVAAAAESGFTTVVTPNVDHVVRLDRLGTTPFGKRYRAAVEDADFCLCDSRVLARLARFRGVNLDVVPGSDLTMELFERHLRQGDEIAILGGDANTVPSLSARFPHVRFAQHMPPMGLVDDDSAMNTAAQFICDAQCRFIFIAVGSPQGEILAHRARQLGASTGVALSVGASIDFLTGRQTRAPRFLQKAGLEWAYRLASDPKRLWRRYLVDGLRIFAIVMRGPKR